MVVMMVGCSINDGHFLLHTLLCHLYIVFMSYSRFYRLIDHDHPSHSSQTA